jgi:hypothetical protein
LTANAVNARFCVLVGQLYSSVQPEF